MSDGWNRSDAIERIGPKLHRYLHRQVRREDLASQVGDWFDDLTADDLRRLSLAHLAAHPDTARALDAVEELLRLLPSTTRRHELVLQGEVRGPVRWDRTFQQRHATGDDTMFICRGIDRRYDTPLARLIRLVVDRCTELDRKVKNRGTTVFQETAAANAREIIRSPAFKHKLGGASRVRRIHRHTLDALANRGEREQTLVRWLRRYEEMIELSDIDALVEVLQQQAFAPDADDRLFELEVGFDLVQAIEELGFSAHLGLLESARKSPFATLTTGKRTATLWWDRALVSTGDPILVGCPSRYRNLLADAQLTGGPLRPDFIVELTNPDRYLIVEVKLYTAGRQESGDEAARVGLRETLAYLADIDGALDHQQGPVGLVVSWDTSGRPETSSQIMISDQHHIAKAMDAWMRHDSAPVLF
jgi:hypothetical protein